MNRRITASILALVAAFSLSGCDQKKSSEAKIERTSKLPDISKMSDAQIEKLSEVEMNKLPFFGMINRLMGGAGTSLMKVIATSELANLSYFPTPSDSQLREAIKRFQRDIGQDQTGDLTVGQYGILHKRSDVVSGSKITISSSAVDWDKLFFFVSEPGYVSVSGTWVMDNDQLAYPINHSRIECTKSEGTCVINEVHIEIPSLDDKKSVFGDEYRATQQIPDTYKILSWSPSEIVFESPGECRTVQMTINTSTKEVFQVTRNSGGDCTFGIEKLKSPRVARLVAPGKHQFEFWNARRLKAVKLHSREGAARLLELMKASEKSSVK